MRRGSATQLQSYVDAGGFRAVKMRVGSMDERPHVSAERVRAARKAWGRMSS